MGSECHLYMVHHVFLPRHLPTDFYKDYNYCLDKVEEKLLALMCEVLREVPQPLISDVVRKLFTNMRSLHGPNKFEPAKLSSQIRALGLNQMLGIYVRNANCGLMLLRSSSKESSEITIATFQPNLTNEQIYGTDDKLKGDIQVDYPTRAVTLEFSNLIQSDVFIEQICKLNETKHKPMTEKTNGGDALAKGLADVSDPKYVTDWLIGAASNCNSRVNEFKGISKKMRDDPGQGFRRSGLWITMKVILQLGLTVTFKSPSHAKHMYKLIMLKFMCKLCTHFTQYSVVSKDNHSTDIAVEIIAKIARRVDKLQIGEGSKQSTIDLTNTVKAEAIDCISRVRQILDGIHKQVQSREDDRSKLSALNRLAFDQHIVHDLSDFMKYLEDRKVCNEPKAEKTQTEEALRVDVVFDPENAPNFELMTNPGTVKERLRWLNDVENWVLQHMERTGKPLDLSYLHSVFMKYSAESTVLYKDDPLGHSRMVLTMLKIIKLIDSVVCSENKLFRGHRTCINTSMFDDLILPSSDQLQTLFNLQQYFEVRNGSAKYPGLLEEDKISENSFSARFARADEKMAKLNEQIRLKDKKRREEKYAQVTRARTKHVNANGKRPKVTMYRSIIMREQYQQDALVFELQIPHVFACLRDMLYIFATKFYSRLSNWKKCISWNEHPDLKEFSRKFKSEEFPVQQIVFFGISCEQLNKTPFRGKALDPSSCSLDQFIDDEISDYNFVIYGNMGTAEKRSFTKMPTNTKNQSVKRLVTFNVEKSSAYENLQWALDSTRHTQNRILATKSKCPADLSIAEYIAFGSLRADGHRLQYFNLYRAISDESLSFETPSVLALIMQTLWEIGPEPKTIAWYRESNEELTNAEFVQSTADLLEAYIERQQRNWRNPLKMVVATLIVCRMFEINTDPGVADRLAGVLLKFRLTAITWIGHIKNEITGSGSNDSNPTELYANVTDVAICGVLTYFVNRHHKHINYIFESAAEYSAVRAWLGFVDTIGRYNTLCRSHPQRESRELLMRMVSSIGLGIELDMKALIEHSPDEVNAFVRDRYMESRNGTLYGMHHVQDRRHMVALYAIIEKQQFIVHIDYVFGDFLIDGLPMGHLPDSITKLPLFQRIFGSTTFDVQPRDRVFSTLQPYNGFHYTFREHSTEGVAVQEISTECTKLLIPHTVMADIVPYLLAQNFSHWFNPNDNTIEFRPKRFSEANFVTEDGIEYKLDLDSCRLLHVKSKRFLLDVRSSSFRKIAALLRRLEQRQYINVVMDEPLKARAELVRMNLNFIIDCSKDRSEYRIESNEFGGMQVSLTQNIGTLFGLRFGLVLESTNESMENRLVIMPHGKFNVDRSYHHVQVEIAGKDGDLRSPSFFVYRVNNKCRTLNANSYAAWFYLATLHVVTSYPLPDPFTGMTGVERALQILQSGFAWSSAPYDKEAYNSLKVLSDVSPIRRFHAQDSRLAVTQWPSDVRHHAAQDAFIIIVRKLMAASIRLATLYTPNAEQKSLPKTQSMIELNARSYARHMPYAPNCSISRSFMKCNMNRITRFIPEDGDAKALANVRELGAHYDDGKRGFHVPKTDIGELIFGMFRSEQTLVGGWTMNEEKRKVELSVMGFCGSASFPNLWLHLYERIRASANLGGSARVREHQRFHLILTLLALKGVDLRQLQVLQAIAAKPEEFSGCPIPPYEGYSEVKCCDFDPIVIANAIDSVAITFNTFVDTERPKYDDNEWAAVEKSLKVKYNSKSRFKLQLIQAAKKQWPCHTFDASTIDMRSEFLDFDRACDEMNRLLRTWYNNYKLRQFTQQIDEIFSLKLRPISSPSFATQPKWKWFDDGAKSFPKHAIDFDGKMCANYPQHAEDIAVARRIFENGAEEEFTWTRFRRISIPSTEVYLVDAQLYPRLVPTIMLPRILPPRKGQRSVNVEQQYMIGALAVVMGRDKRALRISRFEKQTQMEVKWQREQQNPLHSNWRPMQNPEWLLFEIEQDLSIRTMQVKIAERMIQPPDGKHSVMQLNMGEGKTSVIVPIVAAKLANGQQLCTVTVLRHLFQTNLRSLRQCVGGMLQRRVYTMPCRRDMDISSLISKVQCIYEECKEEHGILLTLPEYRLSLQLKIYEAARKELHETAAQLLKVHHWLNANSRHIMDESDALLQPNFQLIYTSGTQSPPDGGTLRWTCVQAVLKRVPYHMMTLYNRFGDQKIEFTETYACDGVDYGSGDVQNRPEVFRPCRLLDASMYDHLKEALAHDFANGELAVHLLDMPDATKKQLYSVLVDKTMPKADLDDCLKQFNLNTQHTILIMSGLLKFEILRLALTKRWRVNYGRDALGPRKMAVPYKAKDVAAEMTEFGHPDVAICLTQLAYYYAGLSDGELRDTFRRLDRSENRNEIYNEWIRSVPAEKRHISIETYSSVNLSDAKQRVEYLFPVLRRNMYVIDYWLSEEVFPREAKMFQERLSCSAWDLCSEQLALPVTGFSGTNDTKDLLPLPILQNDLPELETTNDNVRQTLLHPENDRYRTLSSNTSGMEILKRLHSERISVLLDAGALMLELNNEQVARAWLKLVPSERYDAAIYFSDNDIMLSIDRKGFITEFEYSVYREQLHRCVVYLDDVHTRGTDLQFPRDIRACVTLCGGITRDKTVQACMRMRMLREGHHQISFWASHEADFGIRALSGKSNDKCISVTSTDVINYVTDNSTKFEVEGMSHWLNGAQNYVKKSAAHKYIELNADKPTEELMKELGQRCADAEYLKLTSLYGAKGESPLMGVATIAFTNLRNVYIQNFPIFDWIQKFEHPVVLKLREKACGVIRLTQFLDEEYEKELEYELEQNREVHRPPTQMPATPTFNGLLGRFCGHAEGRWKTFERLKQDESIERLPLALRNTALFHAIEKELDALDQNLWATKDFQLVVQPSSSVRYDDYLRPVWWIVRIDADAEQQQDTFILISPFECNKLIPRLRAQTTSGATLHMFSAKLSQSQDTLINNKALQIPSRPTSTPIPLNTLAQLSWFAGSMYFKNAEEHAAYCNFVGIVPKSENDDKTQAATAHYITFNGYVLKRHRHHFPDLDDMCRFNENPANVTKEIIEKRHGSLGKRSHVGLLLHEVKRPKWDDEDDRMQID